MNHLKNITGYYVPEQHAIRPSKLNNVHGFALINHLLSCSFQIKISQLWGPIPFVLLYSPWNLLVKLHYTLYTVTDMQYVWNAGKTNKQDNKCCVIVIASGINFIMKTLYICFLNRNMKQTHIFLSCCIHFSDDFIPQLINHFSVHTLSYISEIASVNTKTRSALKHIIIQQMHKYIICRYN